MAEVSYWAREDSGSANNPALNTVVGTSTNITFKDSGLGDPDGSGDLILDYEDTNSPHTDPDTDTLVSLDGGVTYQEFVVLFSGTITAPGGKIKVDDGTGTDVDITDQQAIVISVGGVRYYFLPELDTQSVDTQITMNDMPTGRIDVLQDFVTPPAICFARGTLIKCENGEVAIEDLNVGDLVVTADGTLEKIKWIGERSLSKYELEASPQFKPVQIAQDAFGKNKPHTELKVSQQHRMLLEDWRLELMTGGTEALVAAKHLVNDSSIRIDNDADGVVYFHVLFDTHQVIFANGTPSESFHPGQWAIDTLAKNVRAELLELFPELADGATSYGPTARPALKSYEAKAFVAAA